MLFLCQFRDWLRVAWWFLDLALSAPKPVAAEAPGPGRESSVSFKVSSLVIPISSELAIELIFSHLMYVFWKVG